MDRQTDTQTSGQTDRWIYGQTDTQTETVNRAAQAQHMTGLVGNIYKTQTLTGK